MCAFSPSSIQFEMAGDLHKSVHGTTPVDAQRLATWYWQNGYSLGQVQTICRRLKKVRPLYPLWSTDGTGFVYVNSREAMFQPEEKAWFRVLDAKGKVIKKEQGREALASINDLRRAETVTVGSMRE